ncbi:MAG: hypothetical protein ABL903_18910 [Methylococcales bacterium]
MMALRCTKKLLTAMKTAPVKNSVPKLSTNRLGDWSLNLLHTRPKSVVAVCEHGRLGLVLDAAPYVTLPQRFVEAVYTQLLAIGVPPATAQRECDAMQPLVITPTTSYANRLSLQANLKDYAWLVEIYKAEHEASLTVINQRLADNIVGINGKLDFPKNFVCNLLLTE